MRRCRESDHREPAGAPDRERCAALVDEIVESGWREFVARKFDALTALDIAEMAIDKPGRHLWRVVSYDRLICTECGDRLSRAPTGCAACDLAQAARALLGEGGNADDLAKHLDHVLGGGRT